LARHEEKKDQVLQFLTSFVNDNNSMIRAGAIKALGALEDPRAVPLLQTFASASKTTPEQPVAQTALEAIRSARPSADNLKELRDSILDLQNENRQLRKDLDDLQKKLGAKPLGKPSSAKPAPSAKP
jgi:aminopeptidase N